MSSHDCRALVFVALLFSTADAVAVGLPRVPEQTASSRASFAATASVSTAAFGRTQGSFSVSSSGAATYSIPIWTPPGPNGLTPSISLSYDSQAGNGLAGVGWNLNATSSIERCPQTVGQDSAASEVTLTSADRFCLGGNRLRLGSGTYGTANAVYFTELADFSRIKSFSYASGGEYFVVEAKSGLKYEYGNSADSRVTLGGSTVLRWMLNKVSDRSNNTYVITYNPATGFAVPDEIRWTPVNLNATTYSYTAKFNYLTSRANEDSYIGKVAGLDVSNHYRLENVEIKIGATVERKYFLAYDSSTETHRSRLTSVTECASSDSSDCLLPLTLAYQAGQSGVTSGAVAPPAGSSTNLIKGRYDFNGDGKDDIAYWGGSSWYVLLSANSGFTGPYNTGFSVSTVLVDRFLPTGRDAFLGVTGGTIWTSRWDDSTSAFVSYNTGVSSTVPTTSLDYNGDGLADLIYLTTNATSIQVRANTSTGSGNPSFWTNTVATAQLTGNKVYGGVSSYFGKGLYRMDINGDGRRDLGALVVYTGMGGGATKSTVLLGSGTGLTLPAETTWTTGSTFNFPVVNFNGDSCTDRIIGSSVLVSACAGTAATSIPLPGTPLLYLDWNGDGKTDVLVDNGGTFGVYLSTGAGFSSLIATSISSAGTYFDADLDGDRQDDLVKVNGTSPFSYWTHTAGGSVPPAATNIPDLLSSVTDGYGVTNTPSYVSTAWSNYSSGPAAIYPLFEFPTAKIVVSQVTSSDGAGGTFTKQYFYVGARVDALRAEDEGFQRVDVTDSRTGLISRTYFIQDFPRARMVEQMELMQPNGTTPIVRAVFNNVFDLLDTTPNNDRYFPYQKNSTTTQYEVGGSLNSALLRTVTTADLYDTASGTLYNRIATTTEPASGANGIFGGGSWEAHTNLPVEEMLNDTDNWCMGRPKKIQQINSSNLTYGATITRLKTVSWDAVHCRPTQTIDEPGGALEVTTGIGYDDFGNVNSTSVTGKNPDGTSMATRTTTVAYTNLSYITGQFPLSVTNALNQQSTLTWDFALGVPLSSTDANGLTTLWQYDEYGRKRLEQRTDGTYSTWTYLDCPGCGPTLRSQIDQIDRAVGGATSGRTIYTLDQFDRSVFEYVVRDDAATYNVTGRTFDARGNVALEYFPFVNTGVPGDGISYNYDSVNRVSSISRKISEANSGQQTSNIFYEGLKTRTVDPQGNQKIAVLNAAGQLARSQDQAGYFQDFYYDAFGGVKWVQDSAGNTLQTASYNVRGMLTDRFDVDMGAWVYESDGLGEVVHIRDAKTSAPNWTQTLVYDPLGRLANRSEAEGTSYWNWGNSSTAKNIGQLESITGPGYSESYAYDSSGRPSFTTVAIAGEPNNYQIDYTYNSIGAVDTLTYPTSTSSYRLKLQYDYQMGYLKRIKDFNAQTTVFWESNSSNARSQITQETLGSILASTRVYDAITGWLKSTQTGTGGGAGVQNLEYNWDKVGNLTSRIDKNQSSLTETFFYDNLYRLDYSTLGSGGINLNVDYDALGNITSKSDVGTYTYHSTKKHQLVSTSNGWSFGYDANGNLTSSRGATIAPTSFNYPASITSGADTASFSYTPDRQYYKQVSNYTLGGNATTIYVGGILEKVTTSTGMDFRHLIRAGNSTIIVSRQSSGANNTYYVTSDHLGSSAAITNSSGGILVNSSFGAFGNRRGANWTGSPSPGDWTAIASTTRTGFTEQTMLDNLGLTHMNGRVYDQAVGRFLSADPLISEPLNTQNYNRYSYVYNNPLSAVDPSGFEAEDTDDRRHPWIEFSFASFFGSFDGLGWFYQQSREQFLEKPDAASVSPGVQVEPTMPNIDSAVAWTGEKLGAVRDAVFPNLAILRERGVEGSLGDNALGAVTAGANIVLSMVYQSPGFSMLPQQYFPVRNEGAVGAAGMEMLGAIFTLRTSLESKVPAAVERLFARSAPIAEGASISGNGSGITVLGHFPDYLEIGEKLGANVFSVPEEQWARMSAAEQRAANGAFLDAAVARGDSFVFSHDFAEGGSTFEWELMYLERRGAFLALPH